LAIKETEEDEKQKMGTLVWDPNVLTEAEVHTFLEKMQLEGEPDFGLSDLDDEDGLRNSFVKIQKKNIITQEEILNLLHKHKYNIEAASLELKREQKFWHPKKPDIDQWTRHDVAIFELGMKTYYKKFAKIQRLVRTKTLAEVIHFYCFWKTTERYDDWKFEQFYKSQNTNYNSSISLPYNVPLKEDEAVDRAQADPRLRNRPRVDYSSALHGPTRKRKAREESHEHPLCFDVGVYVDIDWERVRQIKKQRITQEDGGLLGMLGLEENQVDIVHGTPPLEELEGSPINKEKLTKSRLDLSGEIQPLPLLHLDTERNLAPTEDGSHPGSLNPSDINTEKEDFSMFADRDPLENKQPTALISNQ